MKKLTLSVLTAALWLTVPTWGQSETYDAAPKAHKQVVRSERVATMMPVKKQGMLKAPADLSLFQGLKFYVNLTNSDDWAGLGIGSVPYGVYTYTIGEDLNFQAVSTDLLYNYMASAMGRDELVGVRPMEMFGFLNGVEYDGLDSLNFRTAWSKVYSEVDYSYIPSVMAYDVTSDITYSVQYNAELTGLNWAKWNPVTRRFDVLHKWNNDFQPLAMAATPDGRMFCIGSDGYYYQLDKVNGDASMLGQLSVKPTLYVQAMAYEPKTQHFIWMAVSNAGSAIYAVNPETGELTLIRQLSKNEQASSVFLKTNEAPAKAPAKAENLQFVYSGNGATDGNITFTIPTKTYDGSTLSGNVKMSVWLDGNVLADNTEVSTGSQQTFAFNVSNDNHYVDVLLSNADGTSPNAYLYQYAGFDIPLPVTDVNLAVNGGVSTLTWTAPAGGVNNGYIDYDNVTYNIVRMPGNVSVAEGLKTTTFSETLPAKMERYYYIVTPLNGAEKIGEPTESNQVLTGEAFLPPYIDDFSDESTVSLWTVINVNNDASDYGTEYTWQFQSWSSCWNLSTGSYSIGEGFDSVDDYLVSPGICIEKGLTYALIVSMRNTFAGYKERVSLLIGTDPKDVSTFRVLDSNEEYDVMGDEKGVVGRDWEADFQVEETGTYYFAVRGFTTREDDASGIFVYSLAVNELGHNDAPAEVADFTITPEAEGEMKATVAFTMPANSLGGTSLNGALTANISVDENVISTTITGNPGEAVSTELDLSALTVGVHKFTVSAQNTVGEGKKISAESFIGVYMAPYTNTFDTADDALHFTTINENPSSTSTCKWQWYEYGKSLQLSYYVLGDDEPIWLFFPAIKLEEEQVYSVDFDWVYSSYNYTSPAFFGIGDAANSETQTILADLPYTTDLGYGVAYAATNEIVASRTGKYYPSVLVRGNKGNYGDYIMPTIDNISIKHVASAFAPYSVENLAVIHDMTGALKNTLTFNAPTTDFAKRALPTALTVSIYRTGQAIPLATFENMEPGQAVEWVDEEPLRGNNSYTVVASNEHGRGKATVAETFTGVDVPEAVTNFRIRGSKDNQQAIITWDAVSPIGQNGGVVDNSLQYAVVEYFPNETEVEKQMKVLTYTTDLAYTAEREATDDMEQHFYAVITQTSAGVGKAVLDYTILGKLKTIPFKESFANGGISANGWVSSGDVSQYGASWLVEQDNDEQTAQDGDNGYALCYNGNYYAQYHYGDLITPKMMVDGTKEHYLSFYVYHGSTSPNAVLPTLVVSQSTDDYDFVQICDTISVTEGETGWVKYTVKLQNIENADYMKFCFRGLLSSSSERIWLDNIVIEEYTSTGIDVIGGDKGIRATHEGVSLVGFEGQNVTIYDVAGHVIDNFRATANELRMLRSGIYVIKVGEQTVKITVK